MNADADGAVPPGAARALVGESFRQYQVLSLLGAGGMGEVYLAADTKLHRRVALKFLPADAQLGADARRRFLREARAVAALEHPNICAIFDIVEDPGHSFIVMPYLEGETLAARLARRRPSLRETLDLATQIADALAEAHARQIIHRDVKPANVMVTPRGQVKVLDFGLAKLTADAQTAGIAEPTGLASAPGLVMGTVPYMSPEQVRGESLGARTDIFSFGAMLYEMLSGQPPFAAKSTAEVIAAILTREPPSPLPAEGSSRASVELEGLLRKCLEKDPAQRIQTITEVAAELRRLDREVAAGHPSATSQERPTERLDPAGERRKRRLGASRAAAAALGLLVLAVTVVIAWSFLSRPSASVHGRGQPAVADAYDDYLRGKVLAGSQNRQDVESAIALLQRAVKADPRLAPAWAELAHAYNLEAFYLAPEAEQKQLNLDAEVAVERALALDPDLPEGHLARGLLLWTHARHFPHEQAIQSFKRALALNPRLDEAHHQLGVVYMHIGLLDRGRAEIEQTLAINPGNTMALVRLGIIDVYLGKYDAALAVFRTVPPEANPSLLDRSRLTALFQLGRTDEASALAAEYLRTNPRDEGGSVTAVEAMLQARAGSKLAAHETIRQAIELGRGFGHFHHTAYSIAAAHALLAEPAEAVKWLEVAADDGFPCYPLFANDPNLASLRQNKQFITFMVGLRKQWEHYRDTL